MTLADRLIAARARSGLSLDGLGKRCGAHLGSVHRWEKGTHEPNLETVDKLARALNVRREWLAFGTGSIDEPYVERAEVA